MSEISPFGALSAPRLRRPLIPIQIKVIRRVVGVLLSLFSGIMLIPLGVGMLYHDPVNSLMPFLGAFALILSVGVLLYLPVRNHTGQLRVRDGFLAVSLFWLVLGIAGGLPLYFYTPLELSMSAAVFESMSGLTTTGATVLVGLDALPKGILFYRQFIQWFGGMGIIVLAIAILPMLGIGGQQLFRAETPGVTKQKLTPRLAETAKVLWYIYVGLTLLCIAAYAWAGMSWFDAIGHAFATVATGGLSTHDASIGFFESDAIEMVAVVFMTISGVNFALHFTLVRDLKFSQYWQDEEFRVYIGVLCTLTIVCFIYLYITHTLSVHDSFLNAMFHVVSIGTSTGFTSEEYFNWPGFLPVLLLFVSFVGGCTGSTAGGMKVLRVTLLYKQGYRELSRLLHPSAVILVKIGQRTVPKSTIDAVWGFFAAYLVLFTIMLLLLMAAGLDQVTAFSAVAACINNLGPGLGKVAANYSTLGDFELAVLSMAMLFGRLEIFTLLVLFTPAFWRV